MSSQVNNQLPDVAVESAEDIEFGVDFVGMESLDVILDVRCSEVARVAAKANVGVNLLPNSSRGIHMSRLFLALQEHAGAASISADWFKNLLPNLVESQGGVSDSAEVELCFDYLSKQKALVSETYGLRSYPIALKAQLVKGKFQFAVKMEIVYSSTCPCSAALSRAWIQKQFSNAFPKNDSEKVEWDQVYQWLSKESSIAATPHSQRSVAEVELQVSDSGVMKFPQWISLVEENLKTAVQSSVKRVDEQAFAVQNASQLMFCEDAGRLFKSVFDPIEDVHSYAVKAEHQESLHPHNAVSIVRGSRQ